MSSKLFLSALRFEFLSLVHGKWKFGWAVVISKLKAISYKLFDTLSDHDHYDKKCNQNFRICKKILTKTCDFGNSGCYK